MRLRSAGLSRLLGEDSIVQLIQWRELFLVDEIELETIFVVRRALLGQSK